MAGNQCTFMKYEPVLKILKILSPAFATLFILVSWLIYNNNGKDGTVELIVDEEYLPRIVADIGGAKSSIKCAMYMFKFDAYIKNNLQEPTPLLSAAFIYAAKRGVKVSIILDEGKEDDLTTKYNTDTAKYLNNNGVNVIFDSPEKRLHSKMCLIDDKILYIGSHNYTFSAMKRNSEASVRVVSQNTAKEANQYLKELGLD